MDETTKEYVLNIATKNNLTLSHRKLCQYLATENLTNPTFLDKLYKKLAKDKKNQDGKVRWVLLKELGEVQQPKPEQFTVEVSRGDFEKAFHNFVHLLP